MDNREQEVNVSFRTEEGIHFNIAIPKSLDEKMQQIRQQDPERWKDTGELLNEARRQRDAEKEAK